MYIAELCSNNQATEENNVEINAEYWSQCHQKYSEEAIGNMTTWLSDVKRTEASDNGVSIDINIDPALLNTSQRKVYDIVESHFSDPPQKQLLMVITGLAGSGKSFVIDALRALLKQTCIVTAFSVSLRLMLKEKLCILY